MPVPDSSFTVPNEGKCNDRADKTDCRSDSSPRRNRYKSAGWVPLRLPCRAMWLTSPC